MGFYSFVVWTPREIQIRDKGIVLDPGTNAFNVQTDDVDTLKASFEAASAKIVQVHRLDEFEAITPEPEIALRGGSSFVLPSGDK